MLPSSALFTVDPLPLVGASLTYFYEPGTVFTTFHFLCKLRMGIISLVIRLHLQGLQVTNTLAYWDNFVSYEKLSVVNMAPGAFNLSTSILY